MVSNWVRNVLLLGLVVAAANVLFFRQIGSLGVIFIWAVFTLYAVGVRKIASQTVTTLGFFVGMSMLLAGALLFRSNGDTQSILRLALFGSTAFITYCLVTGISFLRSLSEVIFVPFSLFGSYFSVGVDWAFSFLTGKPATLLKGAPVSAKLASKLLTLFAGLVVGIPVSAVLLFLLTQADPIFAKTVDTFFKSLALPNIGPRIILSGIVLAVAAPIIGLKIRSEFSSPGTLLTRPSLVPVMSVVMVLVGFVLGTFLVVQAPYVFVSVAHEMDLSKFGVATYSEYTKRGFAELLMVSVLVYALVWLGLLGVRAKKSGKWNLLLGLNTLVLVELGIFILSVVRRIRLYWNFHGLSLIRVYGGFFLLIIAIFTATLFLRHFFKKRWVTVEAILVSLALIFFGWWNAEQYIVFNHPPTVNGWVDAVYLSRMSPDGYQGWEKSYEWARGVLENPQLQTKEVLTEEDRRKISYAGMVVGFLTRHYHNLVLSYASEDEWKDYHLKIFTAQKERIDGFIPAAKAELSLLQQKGSTVSGNLDPVFLPYYGPAGRASAIQNTIADLEQSRRWIEEEENYLASASADRLSTKKIRLTPIRNLTRFTEGLCGLTIWEDERAWQWCLPSFYATPANESVKIEYPDNLDRFVGYNMKEREVFAWMKTNIPASKLLELQDWYIRLYYRIISQPENEWDYQLDISLYVPFVERL